MKKKQAVDLNQEYTPNAATAARERERERAARWGAGAAAREVERRRMAAEEARRAALPIDDQAALSRAVADLAAAHGLRRVKR